MIRVVLFLVAVLAIAAGFAWVADRPGDVSIVWMGYRVETSLMVAALAVAALVVVAIFLWSVLRGSDALAGTGVAVLPTSPRDERLSRHLARAGGDRRRRSEAGAQIGRRGGAAVARRSVDACCSRRNRRRWPATAAPPSAPSAPWQRATTPNCWACAASMSKRSAATIADAARRGRRAGGESRSGAHLGRTGRARRSLRGRRLGRRIGGARAHPRHAGQGRLPAQACGAVDGACDRTGRERSRWLARRGARGGQARPRSGAGGGAGRAAADGIERAAQGAAHSRQGLGDSTRIPTSPRLTPICGSAIRRASV